MSVAGKAIPLSVPEFGGNEWKYVKECLDTGWVSSVGPLVDRFERELAAYVGAAYSVAVVNGTAALHIALLVAGVEPEDEVLVSTLSFIAPANAIRYVGAWPVFMDAEAHYWQMDPEKAIDFLEKECCWRKGRLEDKVTKRRVRAIVPVHILGHPCDMSPIVRAARKYNLVVIEDASESLGAKYKGKNVGRLGDIACFSFNGNKIITSGGGGMIVTDNEGWARKARYLTTQAKDDPVEFIHNEIGYNYRLTNIQAALGVAQLERLDEFIEKKRVIAQVYRAALSDLSGIAPMPSAPDVEPIYWLYTVLLSERTTLERRKGVLRDLIEKGIDARPLWHTIHDLPPYRNSRAFRIENSPRLYEGAISLPSSVGITEEQVRQCALALQECAAKRFSTQ
ncbi:LegC family aminotransferase [Candidatus Uhrbacteria bacterium]|nr:LegC family aminotransferase [Candidatus Uhrbacteria bacterium]